MICPECGHARDQHPEHHDNDDYCNICNRDFGRQCYISHTEIKLHYWKAEAMAARALLAYLLDEDFDEMQKGGSDFYPHNLFIGYTDELQAYLTARVEDTP